MAGLKQKALRIKCLFPLLLQSTPRLESTKNMLRFCYDRLHSLMMTLEITDTDEFMHIQTICDFAILIGTYTQGFSIIIKPNDERMPDIRDPVIQVPRLLFTIMMKL